MRRLNYILPALLLLIALSTQIIFSVDTLALELEFAPGVKINKEFTYKFLEGELTVEYEDSGLNLTQLYLRTYIQGGELIVGRKYFKAGPGHFANLALSDNIPLDMIYYQADYQDFIGTMLVAYLGEGVNKQLFFHRLEYNHILPGLSASMFESMVVHKKIHPAYYLPLPYWPYYLNTNILGMNSDYNSYEDKYLGLDFSYDYRGIRFYGELLVDELPSSSGNNPDKRAHLLGVVYPYSPDTVIRAEYSNVFNYVYLHRYPENNYTDEGRPLGHWLGNDGDVLEIELAKTLKEKAQLKVGLQYLRKGIGDMQQDFGAGYKEKEFLSELTRTELHCKIGYTRKIRENIQFNGELDYGLIKDYTDNSERHPVNIAVGFEIEL